MKLVELGPLISIYKERRSGSGNCESSPKEGFLPLIDVDCLRTGIVKKWTDGKMHHFAEKGEILVIGVGSSSGFVRKSPVSGYLGGSIAKITSTHFKTDFLHYFLANNKNSFEQARNNAIIPQFNWQFLKSMKIPLPSLNDQQKLVEPLVLLDAEGGASSAFKSSADSIKKQFSRKPLKAN